MVSRWQQVRHYDQIGTHIVYPIFQSSTYGQASAVVHARREKSVDERFKKIGRSAMEEQSNQGHRTETAGLASTNY